MITATARENRVDAGPAVTADTEENVARAAFYGVLAHLFVAAPSPALLQQIAVSRNLILGKDSPVAAAWHSLCDAAEAADASTVRSEYDALFVSASRPAVSLYASSYMSGRQRGQLLAELRDDLRNTGYQRAPDSFEYEDHLSALCEVMRGLVVDEATGDTFAEQQFFFRSYLAPWYSAVCAAITAMDQTDFYRLVVRVVSAFFANESEYFELA